MKNTRQLIVDVTPSDIPDALVSARRVLEIEINGLRHLSNGLDEVFVKAIDLVQNISGRVIVTGMGKVVTSPISLHRPLHRLVRLPSMSILAKRATVILE